MTQLSICKKQTGFEKAFGAVGMFFCSKACQLVEGEGKMNAAKCR